MLPSDHAGQAHEDSHTVVLVEVPEDQRRDAIAILLNYGGEWSGNLPDLVLRQASSRRAMELVAELSSIGAAVEIWTNPTMEPIALEFAQGSGLIPIAASPADSWIMLANSGDKKIQVIKEVRTLTSLGLKEAKDAVDGVPSLFGPFTAAVAVRGVNALTHVGATCELVDPGSSLILDVVLLKIPRRQRRFWPSWLSLQLRGVRQLPEGEAPFIVARRLNSHLAENVVRTIEALGGQSMTVPSDHVGST